MKQFSESIRTRAHKRPFRTEENQTFLCRELCQKIVEHTGKQAGKASQTPIVTIGKQKRCQLYSTRKYRKTKHICSQYM